LIELGRRPKIVLSSSIQAELDNPYGVSKRNAEDVVAAAAFVNEIDAVI
jgi:UDP-2-acetamido-2,6-beta-L-arabino-hexul-4-ose reductase